jgi:hypothetical protein
MVTTMSIVEVGYFAIRTLLFVNNHGNKFFGDLKQRSYNLSSLVFACLGLSGFVVFCYFLPCLVLLVLSCHVFSRLGLLSLVLSCFVLFCLVFSCLVLFCLVWACRVLSCVVLFCLVLSRLVLSCFYLVVSCLVLPRHVVIYAAPPYFPREQS